MSNAEVSETRGVRLFTKNTGHRRPERVSMVADVCSLPVPECPVQGKEGLVKSGGIWCFKFHETSTPDSDPLNEEQIAL